jgi:hypothetical protein
MVVEGRGGRWDGRALVVVASSVPASSPSSVAKYFVSKKKKDKKFKKTYLWPRDVNV